ncbi:MAG: hypothetical protein ACRCT1_06990 [Microcoleaceae cyanobacterium]
MTQLMKFKFLVSVIMSYQKFYTHRVTLGQIGEHGRILLKEKTVLVNPNHYFRKK